MDAAEHPMTRRMYDAEPADMYAFLERNPPTPEQADALAAEELIGKAREEVFALLDFYRGRK